MAEAMIKEPMEPEIDQPAKGTGRPRGRPRKSTPSDPLTHSQAEARRRGRITAGFEVLEPLIHTDRIQAARARDLEKAAKDPKKTAKNGKRTVTQAMILNEGAEYLLSQERLCKQLAAEENQKIQLQQQLQQTKQQLQAQLDQLRSTNRQEAPEEEVSPEEGALGEPFNDDLDLANLIEGGDIDPCEMMELDEQFFVEQVSDLLDQFSLPVVTEAVPQHDPILPSFWDEPNPLVALHEVLHSTLS